LTWQDKTVKTKFLNPTVFNCSGTSLLPPELDHFNRVNLPECSAALSSEDETPSSENGKEKVASAKKAFTTTPTIAPGAVRKSASNLMSKKQQQQSKNLPPSGMPIIDLYLNFNLFVISFPIHYLQIFH